MQCPHCGNAIKPTAIYCHRCGHRLVEKPAAPTTAQTNVQDTQPVAPVPPPLSSDALEQLIAAETRELSFSDLRPAAASDGTLTPGMMIGEHYRVERLVAATDAGPLYEVTDLWATERCWSCGSLWQDGDDDHFCVHCGAQRHGKMLYLRQQPLRPELLTEAATVAPNAIIHGDQMFVIVSEDEVPLPFTPTAAPTSEQSASAVDNNQTHAWNVAVTPPSASPNATLHVREPSRVEPPPAPATERPEAFATSSGQFDSPTVEAPFFEVTSLLPGYTPRWDMRLGIMSDVGMARRGRPNEDSTIALHLKYAGDDTPPPLTLAVVADGLGGHDNGQRAGRLAARIITRSLLQQLWLPSLVGEVMPPKDPAELGTLLRSAILDANMQIQKINFMESGDMGCTVTAFVAQGEAACVANVGDSRTYRFDGHQLSRVTIDHSLVARLVAAGMLAPDDVYTHPQRSQIYRSLGDEGDLQVDIFPHRLRVGESFVLCSDGLWEMVHDPDIAHLLTRAMLGDPQALAQQLVEMANEHGGDDNISVVVVQVVG